MLPRSLRWQIQLWHAALLVALVSVVLVFFYGYERQARVTRLDAELTGPLIALLPRHLRLPGRNPPGAYDEETDNALEVSLESTGHYILIFGPDGRTVYASPNAPDSVPGVDPAQKGGAMQGRWNGGHRELINKSPRGDIVILARNSTALAADLRAFTLKLAGLGVGVVALGLVGGHFIARRATGQLRAIGEAARRVAAGGWHERIPGGSAPAEIEELRGVLNDSFDRIADAYERQRRFTADASHELGTPVAIILGKTQHTLSRPRSPEDYVAALAACQRAGERMKALNRQLLDLASCDASTTPARRVECDLAELAREAAAQVATHAAERQARIEERLESIPARVDPLGLGQVLINLLNNALAHNKPGVRVTLSLRRENDHAVFSVGDDGAGIPEAALPHLFERFYRADSARTHDKRGAGLGLSIVQEIVRLHEGAISAANQPGGGALFTVRLPLKA